MKRRSKFLLLLPFALLLLIPFSKVTPRDQEKWNALRAATQIEKKEPLHHLLSKQKRSNLSKEIYLDQEKGGVRYLRIDSKDSSLLFCSEEKEMIIKELLTAPIALVQDQSLRLLQAKEASIDYTHKQLYGEELLLYSYPSQGEIPPSHLSGTPEMILKAAEFLIDWENEIVHCQHLYGSFGLQMISAPSMTYFVKEDKMLFEKDDKEVVYFYDLQEQTTLSAAKLEGYSLFTKGKERWHATQGVRIAIEQEKVNQIKESLKK